MGKPVENVRSPGSLSGLGDRQEFVREAIKRLQDGEDREAVIKRIWGMLLCNRSKAIDIVETAENYITMNGNEELPEE